MNAQFELDPGRVYSDFRRVIDDHSEVAKPKYVTIFGKTGLNENSVVMHFECVDNAF